MMALLLTVSIGAIVIGFALLAWLIGVLLDLDKDMEGY